MDRIADQRIARVHAEIQTIDDAGCLEADPLIRPASLPATSTSRLIGLVTPSMVRSPVTRATPSSRFSMLVDTKPMFGNLATLRKTSLRK
jgi:hypothetical protein